MKSTRSFHKHLQRRRSKKWICGVSFPLMRAKGPLFPATWRNRRNGPFFPSRFAELIALRRAVQPTGMQRGHATPSVTRSEGASRGSANLPFDKLRMKLDVP